MKKEPFVDNMKEKDLLKLPGTLSVKQRMDYIISSGGVMVVTGDVGSGKSTSIRWVLNQYHKSEISYCYVTANSGSPTELYKQLCWGMNLNISSSSRVLLLKKFKIAITEIMERHRNKTIVIIDEASLLRPDVFAELHTINQFNFDSEKRFSLVLVGQNTLIDKLKYRSSIPLASRVMVRAHLSSITEQQMEDYLDHHVKISGVRVSLFTDNAVSAIWQGSGGLLRRANFLAKGALIACMVGGAQQATEEDVRKASTELI